MGVKGLRKELQPPPHLTKDTRDWWVTVVSEYDLDSHHLRLLRLACEAWDRAQEAREVLAREGITFKDRFGRPAKHPAVSIEEQARIGFARLVRELGFDVASPDARPPRRDGRH